MLLSRLHLEVELVGLEVPCGDVYDGDFHLYVGVARLILLRRSRALGTILSRRVFASDSRGGVEVLPSKRDSATLRLAFTRSGKFRVNMKHRWLDSVAPVEAADEVRRLLG